MRALILLLGERIGITTEAAVIAVLILILLPAYFFGPALSYRA